MARTNAPEDPDELSEKTPPSDAQASSTAFSAGSEPFFDGDGQGPVFDPDQAPEAPHDELGGGDPWEQPEPAPGWDVKVVESLLSAKGTALHAVIGKAETDWIYTPLELRATAPPLTRILNRIPVTAAAAGSGDELALMIALGTYIGRSVQERQAAIKAERDAAGDEPEPLGAPVFAGAQPYDGGSLT